MYSFKRYAHSRSGSCTSTITGGWTHLPYLLSISVSMAVIKDFLTNYMKAIGLNQAYMLLKLPNNYYIMLICSFGSITGNILQLQTKSLYVFSLFG